VRELAQDITLEYRRKAEKVAAIGEYLLENHGIRWNLREAPTSRFLIFCSTKRARTASISRRAPRC
jgi:hypothetical protein